MVRFIPDPDGGVTEVDKDGNRVGGATATPAPHRPRSVPLERPGAQYENTMMAEDESPEEESNRGGLKDFAHHGVVGGLADTINSTSDLAYDVGKWVYDNSPLGYVVDTSDWENPLQVASPEAPERIPGQIARPVTNFLSGFIGAGKFKAVENVGRSAITGAHTTGGLVKRGFAKGAIADGVAMNVNEELLTEMAYNYISESPELQGPLMEYLSDPDEAAAERRILRVLEGAAMGGVAEGVFAAFRTLRHARHAKNAEAEARIIKAGAEDIEKIMSKSKIVPGSTPQRGSGVMRQSGVDPEVPTTLISQEDSLLGSAITTKSRTATKIVPEATKRKPVQKGIPPTTTKSLKQLKSDYTDDLGVKVREYMTTGQDVYDTGIGSNLRGILNLNKHGSTPEHKGAYEIVLDAVRSSWDDGVMTVRSNRVLGQHLADTWGTSLKKMSKSLEIDTTNVREASIRYHAAKIMSDFLIDDMQDIARRAGSANKLNARQAVEVIAEFDQKLGEFTQLGVGMKNLQKEFSRALGNLREPIHANRNLLDTLDVKELERIAKRAGGVEKMDALMKGLTDAVQTRQVTRALSKYQETWKDKMGMTFIKYMLNNMLSGFKTHVVNNTTSAAKTVVMPAEMIMGGAWEGVTRGDWAGVRHGARVYAGLSSHAWDAIKMAGTAFKRGKGQLDPGNYRVDAPYLVEGNTDPVTGAFSAMYKWLDTMNGLSFRGMMMSDELFKQMNYRAKVTADLYDKAAATGIGKGLSRKEQGLAVKRFVDENFEKFFDSQGRATSSKHLSYTRQSTFTNDLQEGWDELVGKNPAKTSFGKTAQNAANNHLPLKIAAPFIRTPVNLWRDTFKRMPGVGMKQYQHKGAMKRGGLDRTEAIGQQMFGAMLWTAGIGLAVSGRFTSGGPKDAHERRVWNKTEDRYSYITDSGKRINLQRFAPFSVPLMMAADFVELFPYGEEKELDELAGVMAAILNRYMESQTFLTGITQLISAMDDSSGGRMEFFARSFAGNLVPFSSFWNQIRQGLDSEFREVDSIKTHIMNRFPGGSQQLAPKYNWLTGEVTESPPGIKAMDGLPGALLQHTSKLMSPWPVNDRADQSFVLDELRDLRIGLSSPTRDPWHVELTNEQRSELNRLTGTTTIQGRTLMEALAREMKSKRYDLKREVFDDPTGDYRKSAYRHERVRKIVNAYKEAGRLELLRNDESLQEARIKELEARSGVRSPQRNSSRIDRITSGSSISQGSDDIQRITRPAQATGGGKVDQILNK